MKFTFFVTFLISFAKAWLWIAIGVLIRNHFETVLNMILRKPIPEGLLDHGKYETTKRSIRLIGGLLMAVGILLIVMAFATWTMSFSVPTNNFKLNF